MPRKPWWTRIALSAGWSLVVGGALAGCHSAPAQKDWSPLEWLMKQMATPRPGQLARDVWYSYDADKRREGLALLGSSKFGGEDVYLRMYRSILGFIKSDKDLEYRHYFQLEDADATVRAAAVRALGLHGTADDAKILVHFLSDKSVGVRREAAAGLQKLHHPAAVRPLRRVLVDERERDPDVDVRMAAATALGQYAQPEVYHALVGALNDADYGVAQAARASLVTMTGYDFGPDSRVWDAYQKEHGQNLFAHRQDYTWQPWAPYRGFWQKVQFWSRPGPPPQPRPPTGMQGPEPVAIPKG